MLTSAVRDAANGAEFAATVRDRYGLEPHVLSGDQEARLTFLGATSERDPDDHTPTLVIDIGGGSTELVIGAGHEVDFNVSTQAGVVRQTERHIHTDPPTRGGARRARARRPRDPRPMACPPEHRAGGRGARSAWPARRPRWARSRSGSTRTTPRRCTATCSRPTSATAILAPPRRRCRSSERRQVPGLDPSRAPTIVAGVIILTEVMELFGLEEIEISEHDILRGAALEFSRR